MILALLAFSATMASQVAGPAAPPAQAADPPPAPFGVTFGPPYPTAVTPRPVVLDRARDSGAAWVRWWHNRWWADAEPTEGVINWAALAPMERDLAAISARGLRVDLVVFGTPAWARAAPNSSCGPVRPDKYAAFADFVRQMVLHFKAAPYNVHQWELWNEPDAPVMTTEIEPFGCWGDPASPYYGGDAYGRMLKVVYPAIKAADPGATVTVGGLLMGCGVAGTACSAAEQPGLKFLRGILAAGAGNAFDLLAYHSYVTWPPPSSPPSVRGSDWDRGAPAWAAKGGVMLGKLSDLRATLGGLRKPIVMDEGALLWCDPANPSTWCHQQNVANPGPDYLADQANYLTRTFTRAWAYGLSGVNWYNLENGGWRGDGLLDPGPAGVPRPAYGALRTLSGLLRGAVYQGGTVTNGHPETAPFEDYQFCAGGTEVRLLWTNSLTTSVSVQLPPGVISLTDNLGRAVPVTDPLRVGFQPRLLRRQLAQPCRSNGAASGPAVVNDTGFRPYQGKVMEFADTNGPPGGTGRSWSRVSTDAAGTRWGAWTLRGYDQAWGTSAGAPPRDRVDAVETWQPPGLGRWRQEVYAAGVAWSRESTDAAGLAWPAAWSARRLSSAWGGDTNHPPVNRVDAVTIAPFAGRWRQAVLAGGTVWSRDGVAGARGVVWPTSWTAHSLAAVWGRDHNHPPVDRVDAYDLYQVTDASGAVHCRQQVVVGQTAWSRTSAGAAGATWPSSWDSRTLAATWGAGVGPAFRPPVFTNGAPGSSSPPGPPPSTLVAPA